MLKLQWKTSMTQKSPENTFIRYFRNPLLGVSTMTSYGLPNALVHIPVIIMFVYTGVCIARSGMKAILAVFFLVALYTARDMVIVAYRNKNVPALLWGMFIPFIALKKEIADVLVLREKDSIAVTLGLLALFLVYVPVFIKKYLKW